MHDKSSPSGRLTVIDDIFLRTHRGHGTPIALQGLWRTADRVDRRLLDAVHAALRTGSLGRRVVRPAVPGARRRWQATTRAHPLDYPDRVLPVAELLTWADTVGGELDPEYGPGWRLAAAGLDDGGSVVSLTCSHALADGRGLVIAVDRALRAAEPVTSVAGVDRARTPAGGSVVRATPHSERTEIAFDLDGLPVQDHGRSGTYLDEPPIPDRDRTGTNLDEPPTPDQDRSGTNTDGGANTDSGASTSTSIDGNGAATPTSDWGDAFRQWSTVLGGTARALRQGIPARPDAPPRRTGAPRTCGVVLQCAADAWDRIAADQDGTANSLFIWLVARILWAAGYSEHTIDAALPVDTRAEPRVDNDLAMTQATLSPDDDPASIREKARAAYEYRMTSPGGMPEEILQVIPDRWSAALAAGAGERDILCSNIGPLPDTLRTLGPHRCTGVAARAIHPGLAALPRTRLSGYLCRSGADYVLSLVALDPAHIPTANALRALTKGVFDSIALPVRFW